MTHQTKGSLYEAFQPLRRGVWPTGSNDRRIPDNQTHIQEVTACEDNRNANHAKADWQFTIAGNLSDQGIRLEHVPKKLTAYFDQNMLQVVVLERILIDRVLPPDRNTL